MPGCLGEALDCGQVKEEKKAKGYPVPIIGFVSFHQFPSWPSKMEGKITRNSHTPMGLDHLLKELTVLSRCLTLGEVNRVCCAG